jgi:hypothetical protein
LRRAGSLESCPSSAISLSFEDFLGVAGIR